MPSSRRNNEQSVPKTPTATNAQKTVPLPQVGDISPVELKKKDDAKKKSVKQNQQPAVKKEIVTDKVNLFDRPPPFLHSFPAYLCDTASDVERGEADLPPTPSELFAVYCRSKVLQQAKQRPPVSPQRITTTTRECYYFVPLTNEHAFAKDCDEAVGPVIGTFSLINRHSFAMRLLSVHQRGRQLGVMTTTKTLAELGLVANTGGTASDQETSIVDLLARNKTDHLQMNLVMFSRANILDNVLSRFPFPTSSPESGFTISSTAVAAVSRQSNNQVQRPEQLLYSEEIEVFGFPLEF